jgi:hypothetical protein
MASQGEIQQEDHGIQDNELEVPVEQDQNHAQMIVIMLPSEAIRNVLQAQGEIEDNLEHYNQAVAQQQSQSPLPSQEPVIVSMDVPPANNE